MLTTFGEHLMTSASAYSDFTNGVMCSNSAPNVSKIEQSAQLRVTEHLVKFRRLRCEIDL